MNANILYGIFATNEKNNSPDLTIGFAMFKADHPEIEITHEEDKAIREFIGRHYDKLVKAYPDKDKFTAAVETGVAEDAEKAKAKADAV